ncbi:MAG: prolipoprotein diacylglyceryl transferase [Deltaproteobacteria bacterium]|nr:prolipoprotein diacylglyceryl transferase [Deltaproteobacteria bacterium]MCL4873408.1 prolipoprotein diacylglyceryl transferase [bacterium]
MHPVLFEFGPVEIRFYGLMYVIAILVGSRLIIKEAERKGLGLSRDDIMNFIIWTVAGGIFGARLYYVAFNWGYYGGNPLEIPAVWHGGLAIHGGLLGGLGAAWLYLRKKSVPFWRMADAVAPAIILGQAFGRFGNFMNGDAHGRPTDLPWGLVFPPGSPAGSEFPGIPLHPVMLYELFINLGIFSFLWLYLRKKGHKDGFIFASYIVLYSMGRFFVEHFRADSLMLDSLRAAQAVSVTAALAGIIIIFYKRLWEAQDRKRK